MTIQSREMVSLWVDGQIHRGWTSAGISLNLDALCGDFHLALSQRWADGGEIVGFDVPEDAAARVLIGKGDGRDDVVLNGWVDRWAEPEDEEGHTITISGRDKTGDLVDCAAEIREFHNMRLEAIATALCRPFGISVIVVGDTGAVFRRVAVNPGDTVAATIERMCRLRGVLAWSDGAGNLCVGKLTTPRPIATLTWGDNLKAVTPNNDFTQRFSEVVVRGNQEGGDDLDEETIAQPEGRAVDKTVRRHRPKMVIAEAQGGQISLATRAAHELAVSKARSRMVSAVVNGWRHENGVWRPGQAVTVNHRRPKWSGLYVVGNVSLGDDSDGGQIATLTLYPPGAFDRLPEGKEDKTMDDDE